MMQFERYRPLVEAVRFNVDQSSHINAVTNGIEDNLNSLINEAKERIAKGNRQTMGKRSFPFLNAVDVELKWDSFFS